MLYYGGENYGVINGRKDTGGIAGTMRDCKSFVVIEEGTERIGAVAGYCDFAGEIANNTFVDTVIILIILIAKKNKNSPKNSAKKDKNKEITLAGV